LPFARFVTFRLFSPDIIQRVLSRFTDNSQIYLRNLVTAFLPLFHHST
jgi:hypothetical protein